MTFKTSPKTRIGVIGCGNISPIYLQAGNTFDVLEVVACADLDLERARERAAEFGVPKACSPEELLADPEVEVVVNLTIPHSHGPVGLAAVQAGKHVYNEKPLAVEREEARTMLALAREAGLRVGGAPDTFLGAGLQTCRSIIDSGLIGEPIGATAFMMSHGPESWHPNPDFFYQPGGGPLFDMAPYYLTALMAMLGPVRRVSGAARASFETRTIGSKARQGEVIPVGTPTHVMSLLEFDAGPLATLVTSFDVWGAEVPRLEIYGSEGSLSLPDPNTFGGPVRVRKAGEREWQAMELTHGYHENSRGLGVAEMSHAIRAGRPHRASGDLAAHVLDVMHAVLDSARKGHRIELDSLPERPAALPPGFTEASLA